MDLMRLLAAVSIVWLHTAGALPAVVGRFAVPFFSASIGFLVVVQAFRRPEMPVASFVGKRVTRLLVPFYLWVVVYSVVRILASSYTEHVQRPPLEAWVLWNGTAQHLWFLPYAFVLSLLAFAAARASSSAPQIGAIALAIAAIACLVTPNPLPVGAAWYCPRLGFDCLPAGLGGMAMGVAWSTPSAWRPRPNWWWLALTVGCLAAIALLGRTRSGPLENVAGFAALLASLAPGVPAWTAPLLRHAALPYGIYLCHVLFLEGLKDGLRIAGWGHGVTTDLMIFALATALSGGFCLLLTRLRMGWLIGG